MFFIKIIIAFTLLLNNKEGNSIFKRINYKVKKEGWNVVFIWFYVFILDVIGCGLLAR